jgi:hypothetical protein
MKPAPPVTRMFFFSKIGASDINAVGFGETAVRP